MRPPSLQSALTRHHAVLSQPDGFPCVEHFGSAQEEALSAAQGGCVRDQSQRARVAVRGPERAELLQRLCTNAVTAVTPEVSVTAAMTTAKGRVADHVQIVARGDDLLLLGGPGKGPFLVEWLQTYIVMEDCSVDDTAEQDASLLVWGPTATEALQKVVGAAPAAPAEHHGVALGQFNGESVTLVTSAAPGAGGSEIIVPAAAAGELFDQLVAAGLQPVGETAYEQARIEAGIPAMGKDLGEHCNPLEAGLQGSVSFSKGCYLGQEVVARLNSYAKIRRHLKGVKFPASASPDSLGDLFTELLRIGNVTSATHSPRLNATVALAFLKSGYEQTGRTLEAVVEGETIEGVVCETPFEA